MCNVAEALQDNIVHTEDKEHLAEILERDCNQYDRNYMGEHLA